MPNEQGAEIKRLRLKAGISLRAFATRIRISAPHQSDIENGRRLPSDKVLRATAHVLKDQGTSYEALKALDARLDPEIESWTQNNPLAGEVLREVRKSGRPVREVLDHLRHWLNERED
jgi:transcriptional regulator with XRE-family HTH domain